MLPQNIDPLYTNIVLKHRVKIAKLLGINIHVTYPDSYTI